jgi:uncharacterized protein (DUF433 family)
MASGATKYEHIVIGEDGVPRIAGSTTKVVELVADRHAYGWSPEEMQFQHPHLSLGQVHAALAYYWDHQSDLEQDLARRLDLIAERRHAAGVSALATRIKATAKHAAP